VNGRGPLVALAAYLVFLIAHRGFELSISARNQRALRARGAYEVGQSHFLLFVLLHTLYPAALVAEVVGLGTRPGPLWPLWAALVAVAVALRIAAHRALGPRWTARIWVVPGAPPVTDGVYRWLRHPSYVGITIELAAAALLFGAWRTALVGSLLNLAVLAVRIPIEERALAEAAARG
jgi:methyltransferase